MRVSGKAVLGFYFALQAVDNCSNAEFATRLLIAFLFNALFDLYAMWPSLRSAARRTASQGLKARHSANAARKARGQLTTG